MVSRRNTKEGQKLPPIKITLHKSHDAQLRNLWKKPMKPKPQVKLDKCNICGIVLVNSRELLKHKIALHSAGMFQCQSCNKIFDTKYNFENHLSEIHDTSQNITVISSRYDNNSESNCRTMDQSVEQDVDNNKESVLYRRAAHEKKARKRTRGPYRKSISL